MTEKKSSTNRRISVIIPNYNGSSTIGKCLEAVFSSEYDNFEVLAVDDCSTDNSVEIIKRFPCRLIALDKNSGASKARNAGAKEGSGEIFFFIDSDCIVQKNTLSSVNEASSRDGDKIIGGTYTKIPYDNSFFSAFQSIFINYSETKKREPDYIATHAMAIDPVLFKKAGGFSEDFLPILEDVEFSHRLRRLGIKLIMHPEILVQHIFNFTPIKSLRNAFRKSSWWTIYSLRNRDLLKDSGTASSELKINVASYFLTTAFLLFFLFTLNIVPLGLIAITQAINLYTSRNLITAFFNTKGLIFGLAATIYYTLIYPFAVGIGAISGIMHYLKMK
ncbi:MAG: glycosyltransferase [Thermodesulfovibrionales bacterium]|nr:glycosyltransferase [Thermodesulfovibrionales bacterium]MDP3112821.1 glycosyltransferase [Thermodesulfovibrionales bacterium]